MKIQERITSGEQAKRPQGEHRLGAPGDGVIDRRARRAAWEKDDTQQLQQGKPPRGVVQFRVLNNTETKPDHHG
jgi:hypothetical protein